MIKRLGGFGFIASNTPAGIADALFGEEKQTMNAIKTAMIFFMLHFLLIPNIANFLITFIPSQTISFSFKLFPIDYK